MALGSEALSHNGHSDVAREDVSAESIVEIGTVEAARLLNRSPRTVQRMAKSLDGRKISARCWAFDKDTVLTYLASREEQCT